MYLSSSDRVGNIITVGIWT